MHRQTQNALAIETQRCCVSGHGIPWEKVIEECTILEEWMILGRRNSVASLRCMLNAYKPSFPLPPFPRRRGALFGKDFCSLIGGNGLRRESLRQRYIRFAIGDIRTVAAGLYENNGVGCRIIA